MLCRIRRSRIAPSRMVNLRDIGIAEWRVTLELKVISIESGTDARSQIQWIETASDNVMLFARKRPS